MCIGAQDCTCTRGTSFLQAITPIIAPLLSLCVGLFDIASHVALGSSSPRQSKVAWHRAQRRFSLVLS